MSSLDKQSNVGLWINSLQLVTLIVGLFVLALGIGRRDQALDSAENSILELRTIAADMLRAQLDNVATDKVQTQRLDELQRRINRLDN